MQVLCWDDIPVVPTTNQWACEFRNQSLEAAACCDRTQGLSMHIDLLRTPMGGRELTFFDSCLGAILG